MESEVNSRPGEALALSQVNATSRERDIGGVHDAELVETTPERSNRRSFNEFLAANPLTYS